jgi:hypothetical protein
MIINTDDSEVLVKGGLFSVIDTMAPYMYLGEGAPKPF